MAVRPPNPTCRAPARAVPLGGDGLPARLSETGCFDPGDATRPLPALLPYTVNAPLWSDGADKDRWLALPDGARIRVAARRRSRAPAGLGADQDVSAGRAPGGDALLRAPRGRRLVGVQLRVERGRDRRRAAVGERRRAHDRRSQLPLPDPGRVQAVPHRRRRGIAGPGDRPAQRRHGISPGGRKNQLQWLGPNRSVRGRLPAPVDQLPALPRPPTPPRPSRVGRAPTCTPTAPAATGPRWTCRAAWICATPRRWPPP